MGERNTKGVEMSNCHKHLFIVDKWTISGKTLRQLKSKEKERSSVTEVKGTDSVSEEEPIHIVSSDENCSVLYQQEVDLHDFGHIGNEDMGHILSSIIQYLQEKVTNFMERKATLETIIDSNEKWLHLNATICEHNERKRKLEEELKETIREKCKVVHILMNTAQSIEEECKLEIIRHELEKRSIIVQFDIYKVRLGAYLKYQQYHKEINKVSSELIQINEDLVSTEAVLQQCILADLEFKRKEHFIKNLM